MLGSGTYGKVVRVEDQLETEWVAVKISEFKGDDARSLRAEIDLAKRIPRNVNIARYDACYRLDTDMGTSDFAIMKYYPDGNLADLIRKTTLSPEQLNDLVQGILQGLKHLHHNRIVHRDFKPANILISRDNRGRFIPKIADFGLSKLVAEDEIDSSDFDLSDGRGTSSYKAPEQIEGGRVSFNLDLWAFGVILYEIVTGQKPFAFDGRGSSEQAIKREIEKKIVSVAIPSRIGQIPEPYQAIIRRCLVKDIHDRARKEDELLDLLDGIPTLFVEAGQLIDTKDFAEAIGQYEAILEKREGNSRALQGIKTCREGIEKARIEAEQHRVEIEEREQRRIEEEQRERQRIESEQRINYWLKQANDLMVRQKYQEAQAKFEQILAQSSDHEAAQNGLMRCLEAQKPVVISTPIAVAFVDEPTDVFSAQPSEEQTDVFAPVPQHRLTQHHPVVTVNPINWMFLKGRAMLVVFSAILLAGVIQCNREWNQTPEAVALITTLDSVQTATANKTDGWHDGKTEVVPASPIDRQKTLDSKSLHDQTMANARKAFRQKNWPRARQLAEEAGLIRLGSRDAQRLINNIRLAVQDEAKAKQQPTESQFQQAQTQYDDLIEQGSQAAKSNNKSLAISLFLKAAPLAEANGLSRTKAKPVYEELVWKGNRLLELEEYEGAKDRFKMAQAIRNTAEVQQKIKQCDLNN